MRVTRNDASAGVPSGAGDALATELARVVGRHRVFRDAPLAALTTFRVGGPADWLVETSDRAEMTRVLRASARHAIPVTILGGGSNVLVGDRGVRGLVLRTRYGTVEQTAPGVVRADAGVSLNGLVRWTVRRGLGGLEAWAGTPGVVGGAIHGNAHFRGLLIGPHVLRVGIVTRSGVEQVVSAEAMGFGYDRSRLQGSGEVLLWAEFGVEEEDPALLRVTARESLAFRKRTQPLASPSAGCVFQNPAPEHDVVPEGIPVSAGALIDRAGLKGYSVGRAAVSTVHGNFIVGDGAATAEDIRTLIERCRNRVRARFGVALRDEVVRIGAFSRKDADRGAYE